MTNQFTSIGVGSKVTFEGVGQVVMALDWPRIRLRTEDGHDWVADANWLLAHDQFHPTAGSQSRQDLGERLGNSVHPGAGPLSLDEGALLEGAPPEERRRVAKLAAALERALRGETDRPGPDQRTPPEPPKALRDPLATATGSNYGQHSKFFIEHPGLTHQLSPDTSPGASWTTTADPARLPPTQRRQLTKRLEVEGKSLGYSRATMFRYLKAYREHGAWGLVDGRTVAPRDPLAGTHPLVRAAIQTQLELEGSESTAELNRFIRRLNDRIDNALADHPDPQSVQVPSRRALARAVRTITAGTYVFRDAKTTRTQTDLPVRDPDVVPPMMPGQVVELDTNRLDVLAYDPATNLEYALELTIALDHATRSIPAWIFTPLGTKAVDVAALIVDMLNPVRVRPGWDERLAYHHSMLPQRLIDLDERLRDAAAMPLIYPSQLLIDNGRIFVGTTMQRTCDLLGIDLQKAHIERATDKPEIERAFRTINSMFTQHLAGYTGRTANHRGINTEKTARFTLGEIEELFSEFVVSVYQCRPHKGLVAPGHPKADISPNEIYGIQIAATGWIPTVIHKNTFLELLPLIYRKINHGAISYRGLTYTGEITRKLHGRPSPYADPNTYPFRVDPRDLTSVYIKDPWLPGEQYFEARLVTGHHRLAPFSDRYLAFTKTHLKAQGVRAPAHDQLIAALEDLQRRADDPALTTAANVRQVQRSRERAKRAARDLERTTLATAGDVGLPPLRSPSAPDPLRRPGWVASSPNTDRAFASIDHATPDQDIESGSIVADGPRSGGPRGRARNDRG